MKRGYMVASQDEAEFFDTLAAAMAEATKLLGQQQGVTEVTVQEAGTLREAIVFHAVRLMGVGGWSCDEVESST